MRLLFPILFVLLVVFNVTYLLLNVSHQNKETIELRMMMQTSSNNTSAPPVNGGNDNSTAVVITRSLFTYFVHSMNTNRPFPGVDVYISYTTSLSGLKPLPNAKPILNELGPVINDVTSFHYPIDMGNCILSVNNNKTSVQTKRVFIAVLSAPGNFERRDSIRKTWLNHLKDELFHRQLVDFVGFRFFLGKSSDHDIEFLIEKEANLHKDILQVDMIDDYYQVTKKIALIFNWIDTRCSGVDFVLKFDDDVYVNIRNLATTIALQLSPLSKSIYGRTANNLFPDQGTMLMLIIELMFKK